MQCLHEIERQMNSEKNKAKYQKRHANKSDLDVSAAAYGAKPPKPDSKNRTTNQQ
ncbi:hypothetical protein KSB_13780 [Ktedonobacter robiniae]|uniref:Uncharacterized protein n=1 Tax=Ktedonobacter robiniae TaxID=2778365 RepID=A0ABQ3UJK6_9CHLR|nr:hypothetical protein KSB_13780 [Ktedonobacter robiniae]